VEGTIINIAPDCPHVFARDHYIRENRAAFVVPRAMVIARSDFSLDIVFH